MTAVFPLHLIPLLPLAGAAFALLFGKRAGKDAVTLVCVGAVAGAALVAFYSVYLLHGQLPPGGALTDTFFDGPWIKGGTLDVAPGLILDRLSAIMVMVVTGIGFLIHVYSTAYMEHDEGYTRFFGYLNLFMGAMLILVLGDSLLVTFVGWEGVGLCSYLLIGFWFDKEAFAYAGRKAFVVNRIGDFAFLLAMFLTFSVAGSLKYSDMGGLIEQLHSPLWFGIPGAYYIGILVLIGCTGKSAQIPLYVWLPDAMAGPTPVSALIHAATMVTAGVYMVARMHVVFEVAPATLAAVAGIGAATALFAATIAIAQRDLKKVLAYSTISQLGFMFVAVGSHLHGTSNYEAGIFHLVTHAFFKAGLFLGAGSVLHALANQGDISQMGGLKKYLPHTRWTFLIYCLAISGIFPFAGFWSKDAILAGARAALWPTSPNPGATEVWFAAHTGQILYWVLLTAAACTAFYMFRLYFLVFEGEFRGTEEQKHHLHESPPAMTVVLWILALGSLGIGLLGIPSEFGERLDRFGEFLAPVLGSQARVETRSEFLIGAAIALSVSGAAILLAWVLYGRGYSARVKRFVAAIPRLYKTVVNKYYIDEIYDFLIVRPTRFTAFLLWKVVDSFLIDLVVVNGIGWIVNNLFARPIRYLQNGDVQRYIVGILVGAALIVWGATNWTAHQAAEFVVMTEGRDVVVTAATDNDLPFQRLRFRADFEGSFSPEQNATIFKHHYDKPGKHKITIEAYDPRWGTHATSSQKVTIK